MKSSHSGVQRGFTIVELMVAMLLSLILMAGALSILMSSKLTYSENDRLARLQESGRAAVELLLRDARGAGYLGCSRNTNFFNRLSNSTDLLWNFVDPVHGFEAAGGVWSPALDPVVTSAVPGSDVLVLRGSRQGWPVFRTAAAVSNMTDDLTVEAPSAATTVAPNTPMMISDCENASVFAATGYVSGFPNATIVHGVSGTPANTTSSIGSTFQMGAQVIPIQTMIYYVGTSAGLPRPALWQRVGNAEPQILIEGVENLQLLYGLDNNGDLIVDNYVKASAVGANWGQVVAINIAVLIRTEEVNNDLDRRAYQMLDESVGPFNDRRQRSLFITTVTLRNHAN